MKFEKYNFTRMVWRNFIVCEYAVHLFLSVTITWPKMGADVEDDKK